ncbi:MAG: chemotaxis protein CheW [Rickettsiales bacterium]|nr:chemotaxis protein CheW [Rickettsiales bacterium]
MGGELQTLDLAKSVAATHLSNDQEFVTMRIAGQLFGVSVMAVQDVLRHHKITKVPLAPIVVAGLLNMRGRIVTAIDMRARLGQDACENNSKAMNVVVEHKQELFSFLIDEVGDVMSLPLNKFEKVPPNLTESWREFSAGVFKLKDELLVILDVERVIDVGSSTKDESA